MHAAPNQEACSCSNKRLCAPDGGWVSILHAHQCPAGQTKLAVRPRGHPAACGATLLLVGPCWAPSWQAVVPHSAACGGCLQRRCLARAAMLHTKQPLCRAGGAHIHSQGPHCRRGGLAVQEHYDAEPSSCMPRGAAKLLSATASRSTLPDKGSKGGQQVSPA